MPKILYLDQNAWVSLARGAWDKVRHERDYARLAKVVELIKRGRIVVPLSFANIYETSKINDPIRRANIARVQVTISRGRVFRGRYRILSETLSVYLAAKFAIRHTPPPQNWFLSDLWFEAVADYSSEGFAFPVSEELIDSIKAEPASALFHYLVDLDENVRRESVKRFSASSDDLITRIEGRRKVFASASLALRKRAYGATLMIDELDFILETGRKLGLDWTNVSDIASSLARSIIADVPTYTAERELAVRLEDQHRPINENDLRDMSAFAKILPLADIVIGEKAFINIACQAGLDKAFGTRVMTSIDEL